MKKIATLAVLPVIALASCGKSTETTPVASPSVVTPEENTTTGEVSTTTETLNQNISSGSTDVSGSGKQDFSFQYDLYGTPVNVKGVFSLENGKVTAVSFEGTEFAKGQAPLKSFTEKIGEQVIGKELKGLKVDGVSGASLVSKAFNEYLTSL